MKLNFRNYSEVVMWVNKNITCVLVLVMRRILKWSSQLMDHYDLYNFLTHIIFFFFILLHPLSHQKVSPNLSLLAPSRHPHTTTMCGTTFAKHHGLFSLSHGWHEQEHPQRRWRVTSSAKHTSFLGTDEVWDVGGEVRFWIWVAFFYGLKMIKFFPFFLS